MRPGESRHPRRHAPILYLASEDDVVVEYDILIRGRDREGAVDGRQELRVMAVLALTEGKISETRQVTGVGARDA
ncbi:hypothetical protein N7U49_44665 [Streptomyces sp. AD2-2]|nr:hypothetical protein N7U49_44665 [Streptomyces sp. AD2-2]